MYAENRRMFQEKRQRDMEEEDKALMEVLKVKVLYSGRRDGVGCAPPFFLAAAAACSSLPARHPPLPQNIRMSHLYGILLYE